MLFYFCSVVGWALRALFCLVVAVASPPCCSGLGICLVVGDRPLRILSVRLLRSLRALVFWFGDLFSWGQITSHPFSDNCRGIYSAIISVSFLYPLCPIVIGPLSLFQIARKKTPCNSVSSLCPIVIGPLPLFQITRKKSSVSLCTSVYLCVTHPYRKQKARIRRVSNACFSKGKKETRVR